MTGMASVTRRARREQRAAEMAAAEEPAVLVAAAVNVRAATGFQNVKFGGADWQTEGYLHYRNCPEYHQGINIIAYNLSRARLFAVDVDQVSGEPGTTATENPVVADVMRQFFGGPTGQSQMLDRAGRHLSVAGDTWCFATSEPDADQATWEMLGAGDISGNGGKVMVKQMNGLPREVDQERELLFRIWRPGLKDRWQADAMTEPLIPVLRELSALSAMVSSTIKSRLASSGILWLPEDITLPAAVNQTMNGDTQQRTAGNSGADAWLDLITEAMTAPIRDPDSASAVVPLVAMVKGASIKEITHMEFGRDLDATIQPLRDACIRRLAVGMDLPPEVLMGLGQANHWTSWTITEEFAKAFLAPLLEMIADAATQFYLRPALRAMGVQAGDFAVGFDLTALYPRQLNVDNATLAFNAGILKESVYLETLGFSITDMADADERARRLIIEMVGRGNPQTLAELAPAIRMLYPGMMIDTAAAAPAAAATGPQPIAAAPAKPEPAGTPTPTPARQAPPAAGTPPTSRP